MVFWVVGDIASSEALSFGFGLVAWVIAILFAYTMFRILASFFIN
jgi:hypothetical protein